MPIPYIVRKKADYTSGERKELWYAVAKTIQQRRGMTEEFIAQRISERTGLSRGVVEGVLSELAGAIELSLKLGHTVNIKRLGSFQAAVTSKGFENPAEITPREVKLSRIYFVADRKLTQAVRETGAFKIPFRSYMAEEFWEDGKEEDEEE